eukprot:g10143.t1
MVAFLLIQSVVALGSQETASSQLAECPGITSDRAGLMAAAHWIANKPVGYSQSASRWSGIDLHICPGGDRVIPWADCSSLVTWVYWTAFGKGPDFVNAKNWRAGTADVETLVPVSKAVPGDIFLHGNPIWHVTMYMGNGKVLSHGSPKHPPRIQDMCAGFGCPVKVIQHLPPIWPTPHQPIKPTQPPRTRIPIFKKPKRPVTQPPEGVPVYHFPWMFLLYLLLLTFFVSAFAYLFLLAVPQLMWSYCCTRCTDSCARNGTRVTVNGPDDWGYVDPHGYGAGASKTEASALGLCLACLCCSRAATDSYVDDDDNRTCADIAKAVAATCCCLSCYETCCGEDDDSPKAEEPYDVNKPAEVDYQLLEAEINKLLQKPVYLCTPRKSASGCTTPQMRKSSSRPRLDR